MTRDEKIYFSLLRIGLGTESPREILPELAKLQWGEIYRLAVRQGTGALIWDALRQLHAMEYLPLSLRVQWAYNVEQIEDRYRKQEKVLAGLSKFYASHSISLMLLKGYGLSFCYPGPEHRECGDIDIWLFGRQREADELLCREWGIRIDEDKHHHTVFLIDGIMVENHYDFFIPNLLQMPVVVIFRDGTIELLNRGDDDFRITAQPLDQLVRVVRIVYRTRLERFVFRLRLRVEVVTVYDEHHLVDSVYFRDQLRRFERGQSLPRACRMPDVTVLVGVLHLVDNLLDGIELIGP